MTQSLTPVEEPYSPEVAGILEKYPQRDGYILKLFRVFANSTRFLRKGTVNLLDRESPLPMRLREIVILRVTANKDCEYEWGVHVTAYSKHVKLSDEQVKATRLGGHNSACWSTEESLLIEAVDELCGKGRIEDSTYVKFKDTWTVQEQLEILALCGNYHTVSFVANTARLEGEPFGASFPHRQPE